MGTNPNQRLFILIQRSTCLSPMVVYSDPATYYLLPTTYYVPPNTCYLLPTTYYYCCYYCYYHYHHHYLQWGGAGGEGGGGRGGGRGERVTRAYTVEVQTSSVFCSRRVLSYIPFRSIDPLLSLEAVKHGHTISAVGVEPCTGRLYFFSRHKIHVHF